MSKKLSRNLLLFLIGTVIITLLIFSTIVIIFINRETKKSNIIDQVSKVKLSDEEIQQIISNMTIEQKVGQMFIVSPETFSSSSKVTNYSEINPLLLEKYNVGGMIMSSQNIITPDQIKELNFKLSQFDNSLFLCVVEEGGEVSPIANTRSFPVQTFETMKQIGKNGNSAKALNVGNSIGQYLALYGFNVNFAPDCDVIISLNQTGLENRSFGSDTKVVTKMSESVLKGLHNNGILGTAKHFPGYGNISKDTFEGFPISYSTKSDFKNTELVPFKNLIKNNVDFIMVSNAIYPNLSEKDLPATLNSDIIDILKEELNYNGIIITTDLNNGPMANKLSDTENILLAVEAGNDMLLLPKDFFSSYDAIVSAVKSGRISEERINESVTKILKAKNKII